MRFTWKQVRNFKYVSGDGAKIVPLPMYVPFVPSLVLGWLGQQCFVGGHDFFGDRPR